MAYKHWSGWLIREGGATLGIPERGLVLGRRQDCDVVLDSPKASQVHALLTPTLGGLELLAVGRNPTLVDGKPAVTRAVLADGAQLALPGATFTVRTGPSDQWSAQPWVVTDPSGHRYALRRLPFSIGGGERDHLQVSGWPVQAVELHAAGGAVVAEVRVAARLGGQDLLAGAVESVVDGDVLEIGGQRVVLTSTAGPSRETTVVVQDRGGARRVYFSFLPAGGQLELLFPGESERRVVVLAELRARLLAALLSPPKGYEPGDLLPDELLIPAIWSGSADRTRTDLNVLIYRTRKALLKAGLNPERVIERARTGGSTRFLLGRGATVHIS
jgi:hypothetical protein